MQPNESGILTWAERFKSIPNQPPFRRPIADKIIDDAKEICFAALRVNPQIPRITPHPQGFIRLEWLSLGGRVWVDVAEDSVCFGRKIEDDPVEIKGNIQMLIDVLDSEKSGEITPTSWLKYSIGKEGRDQKIAHRGIIFWLESHIETGQFDAIAKELRNNPPDLLDPSIVLTILRDCANLPVDGFGEWKNLAKNTEAWEHVPEAWQ